MTRLSIVLVASLLATPIFFGCKASGGEAIQAQAAAGMAEFKASLQKGNSMLAASAESLKKLQAAAKTDPRPAWTEWTNSVDALTSFTGEIRANADAMRMNNAEYFRKWEEELGTVNDPKIRQRANARRKLLNERYETLQAKAQDAKETYAKYNTQVADLRKMISFDLTPKGIETAAPQIESVNKTSAQVQKLINELLKQAEDGAAELRSDTPIQTPPAQQPKQE